MAELQNPLTEGAAREPVDSRPTESRPGESRPEPLALLVDSDPSAAEFMARALSQGGLGVLVSDRIAGPEGASALLRANPRINVVVLDPKTVPGRDNLQDLQAAGLRADLQVILVAEPAVLAHYAQNAHADIADFLPKPVPRRTLLRAVLEAQRRYAALHEPAREEGLLGRLVERSVVQPPRQPHHLEPSLEVRTLQMLAEVDECRAQMLDGLIEPDATWGMLSELLRAKVAKRRISVTSLCLASKTPVTTALRRVERLLEADLVRCTQDPKDRRRKYIELTDLGERRVHETLRAIAERLSGEGAPPA